MTSKPRNRHLRKIDAALLSAKIVKDGVEIVPVLAPLKGAVGIVITILETVRTITTNKEDWATLGRRLSMQIQSMQDKLSRCPIPHSTQLLLAVNSYEQKLQNVLTRVRLASGCGLPKRFLHHQTDKEDIMELNLEIVDYLTDFMRDISIQTHETVDQIKGDVNKAKDGVERVEISVDAIGDNSHISKLIPVLSATGEDHDVCLHGTRVTVLDPIRQWVKDPSATQVWWLTDVAGAGKSTIAKQLSTEWKVQRLLGGCFFFDKNRPDGTNKQGFCDTLAAQLANNQPRLRSLITQGIKEIGPTLSVSPFEDKLQKLVIRPMEGVALVLVIDAIDECNERDRGIILRSLLSSLSQVPLLKILITSRPERDIVELLDSYRSCTNSLHDTELKSNQEDIAAFVKYKMGSLVRSSELTEKDVDQLAKRVNCLFILASTACKAVQDSPDPQATVRELLDSNHNLLCDVNSLYLTILTKAYNVGQVRQASASSKQNLLLNVLKAILTAITPLTISTIDALLGIKITKRLVGFLSSVLSVRADGTVLILHPTFREFLEDRTVAGDFYLDMADAHRMMAQSCLSIMKLELCFNICRLESSFTPNRSVPDLDERISKYISKELQYGCIYWPNHLISSNITSQDGSPVIQVIADVYPLFWVEVLSALGKIPKAIKDLQDVESLSLGEELDPIINDIKRFLIAFSTPISESIPHIYISALPFTPIRSHIRRAASILFPNIISVLIGCSENWPEPPQEWLGHSSDVTSIAFSPDGRRIVSGSHDKTIRLWDVQTGQPIGEPLRGHSDSIRCIAFSPDGRRIVSGSGDKTIRLWDAEAGRALGEPLRGHSSGVFSVIFSPDGCRILSGSYDNTIRIWDAETDQTLRGQGNRVYSEAFSQDGHSVVSSSDDKTILLSDAKTAQVQGDLKGSDSTIWSMAISPDGRRIMCGSGDKTIHLWDSETGRVLRGSFQDFSDLIRSLVFSPDGHRIVSGSADGTIRLWDTETGHALGKPLKGHSGSIWSVVCSLDGRRIVSGSNDKTIRLWDAETGQMLGVPLQGYSGDSQSMALSPDGRHIVSSSYGSTIQMWNAETGQLLGKPLQGHSSAIFSAIFSPDGRRIASGSYDTTIRLWDAETGLELGVPLQGHTDVVSCVAYSLDGHVIVSGSWDKTIRLWDAETGRVLGEPLQGHSGGIESVAFSPDGRRIVSGSHDNTIRLWDTGAGRIIGEPLRGHEGTVWSVAFSPDGRRIVSSSWDKTIRLWDAETRQAIKNSLTGHNDTIWSVVFSPDGRRIVSGSGDKTIRLWDAETGQKLGMLLPGSSVYSVAFSPDGRRIVSADDKAVRLWDAETRQALGEPLQGHHSSIRSISFSPDGRRIVSGSSDKTIRLWTAETDPVSSLCYTKIDPLVSVHISEGEFASRSHEKQEMSPVLTNLPDFPYGHHFAPPGFLNCTLSEDGWVSRSNELLYWVPSHNRHGLQHPHILTIPTISPFRATWIDFTDFCCGTSWVKCRK